MTTNTNIRTAVATNGALMVSIGDLVEAVKETAAHVRAHGDAKAGDAYDSVVAFLESIRDGIAKGIN